jgi:hypothetical protein
MLVTVAFSKGHGFTLGALIISQKSMLMPDPESILGLMSGAGNC